jgi:hypothetical protein
MTSDPSASDASSATQEEVLEEVDNPIERLKLLSGNEDEIAKYLDAMEVTSPREREIARSRAAGRRPHGRRAADEGARSSHVPRRCRGTPGSCFGGARDRHSPEHALGHRHRRRGHADRAGRIVGDPPRRRARLAPHPARDASSSADALWNTIGWCGNPPKAQTRTFVIVSVGLTLAAWIIVPILVGIGLAT